MYVCIISITIIFITIFITAIIIIIIIIIFRSLCPSSLGDSQTQLLGGDGSSNVVKLYAQINISSIAVVFEDSDVLIAAKQALAVHSSISSTSSTMKQY